MKKLYLITGSAGHLANTIIRQLLTKKQKIRGLLLPHQRPIIPENEFLSYVTGDITDHKSLSSFFANPQGDELIVIHTAGIISIDNKMSDVLYRINVLGTQNIIDLSTEYGVSRFLYTSSVHVFPTLDHSTPIQETHHIHEDLVHGGYSKTKAMATRYLFERIEDGFPGIIVYPSGILGPYDPSGNFLVQMVHDYAQGNLPFGIKGGYDFVDVRDVANGCLLALEKGKIGQDYILSNRHFDLSEILAIIHSFTGKKEIPILPVWMAKIGLPVMSLWAKSKKKRPLYTLFSLATLTSGEVFSHQKASDELGYTTRDMKDTIHDTLQP